MIKSTPIQTPFIRFKRWSRKSYSIFCSLKRVVSIGVLSNHIADASCEKSNVYALPEINNRFSETIYEEDKDVLRSLKELFLIQNVALVLSDASSSREKYTVESYNSAGNGYVGYLFSAFF